MTERDSNVVALMPWDRAVRQARQRKRAIEILDRDDADRAIAALSEIEAFYAVKEIGLDDAGPMLAVLSRDQISTILDLEVWRHHTLDRSDLLYWLAAFREVGIESLQGAARAMDPEALAAFFARRLFIALKPKENTSDDEPIPEWLLDPPEAIEPLVETADGRFIVAARVEDEEDEGVELEEEERKAVLRVLEDLYKDPEDWEWVSGVLRSALTDSVFELEEQALRFRDGRMEDLGFPPLARALEVYTPESPAALERPVRPYPKNELSLPALHASQLAAGLFNQAMQAILSNDLVRRIEGDLVPLANEILVADGVEPGALELLRESLTRMRGYLEIGLAYGAAPGTELDTAVRRLTAQPVRTLFRVGYGATLALKTRARTLLGMRGFAARLTETERAVLGALVLDRPRVSGVVAPMLEQPQKIEYAESQIADLCPWGPSAARALETILQDLEDLEIAARALGGAAPETPDRLEPPAEERTFELWLTTGAAQALLGGAFALAPLDGPALRALTDRLASARDRYFDPQPAIAALPGLASGPRSAVVRRIRRGLELLAEQLSPLVGASTIDPRFVGGVVRRLP